MEEEYLSNSFLTSSGNNQKKSDTSNKIYDLHYFTNLDSENKICFDCGGPFPTYVSINNGVFICSNCANNHKKLGYNISYIHQINAPWDQYLLSYATRGGNNRFKRLCLQYEVPCQSYNENDEEKLNKYLIRVGEYNRLLLRSEVLAEEPPQPLYFEVAKDPINLNIIFFPEFQNYQLFRGEFNAPVNNNSIGEKIWNGTKTTAGVVGSAGGLVYKAGKPVVCFLGGTAFKGLKLMGSSIWNHCKGSDKDSKNENKKNNNINNNNNYGGSQIMNDFALVDYSNEDLCQIRTLDLNNQKDKGSMNVNYKINNNYNNINKNNNYNNINKNNNYNIYTVDGNNSNGYMNMNNRNNNQYINYNNNNFVTNNHYPANNNQQYNNINININKQNSNTLKNINSLDFNNNNFGDFEIVSPNYNQTKDYNISSNSLFENNSFAGMNVQFENTDKDKARQDANNFLLKP